MLAGMPTHYHISCRVRNSESGLDAQVTEHANTVIETNGTPVAALTIWLSTEGSWLVASANCIKSLLKQWENGELDVVGWDSRDHGGDTAEAGYHNDWEVHEIDHDETEHTLFMSGTSCLSEFEFEVTIKPHDVSSQEIERTQEYVDARYLLALSEKIMAIPTTYGTDQSDYDELRAIAARLDQQAVTDDLSDT